MKHLSLLLAALLILAACGEPEQTTAPDHADSASGGASDSVTAPSLRTPSAESTAENEPEPAPIVTFPPLPEVSSCEQLADLWIETLQIWLDSLADVPISSDGHDGVGPESSPDLKQAADQFNEQVSKFQAQAKQIECATEQINELVSERIDRLVANNPTAKRMLESLRESLGASEAPQTPEPSPNGVNWTITTCEEAADVFIEQTQALLLNAFAGMTMAEVEDPMPLDATPESVFVYVSGIPQLRENFLAIGCTEGEVTALIGERLDRLTPDGEVAEAVVTEIRKGVANDSLFKEFITDGLSATPTAEISKVTPTPFPTATPQPPTVEMGAEIVEEICAACHTVAGTSAQGVVGPELTGFANRPLIAGVLENNEENLRAWLADPAAVKPSAFMPNLSLTENQIESLVLYLYTLDGPAE